MQALQTSRAVPSFSYFFPLYCLWGRYFLKETLRIFFLFLLTFYGVFILIDFSTHASHFHHDHTFQWGAIGVYYMSTLVKNMDLLIPFALLVATIKTLVGLNVHHELVALMANGIQIKAILRPLLFLGLFFTLLLFVSYEFWYPPALASLRKSDDNHHQYKAKYREQMMVQHLILKDDSTLLYKDFDVSQRLFHEVYWIRNLDDLYHLRRLSVEQPIPEGTFVDHFTRDEFGQLAWRESWPTKTFSEMPFTHDRLTETLSAPEEWSLSALIEKFPNEESATQDEKGAQIAGSLFYKLAVPWLCLWAVLAPAPFCLKWTRQLPVFLIYAGGIFGLIAIYLILEAAMILAKRQVLPPLAALGIPLAFFTCCFVWRYAKIR